MSTARRLGYLALCIGPFLAAALTGVRDLRLPGVYQLIGWSVAIVLGWATWRLGADPDADASAQRRGLVIAGTLLQIPFTLVAWLWVGLGTPWQATAEENVMRYSVLLLGAVAVTAAFLVLAEVMRQAGESWYATLGSAANLLAGCAYLVWTSFELGAYVQRVKVGSLEPGVVAMGAVNDILLFGACWLTYAATAIFAAGLGRLGWLGRGARIVYVGLSSLALVFLFLRGFSFPVPGADGSPWYTQPGFIVGIPAVPWIMPALLGVSLLRRAG